MSSSVQLPMGYDAYGNAREWREMMRLESRGQSAVKNKVIRGVPYRSVRCECCKAQRKTLLNREGKTLCRECYAKILELRLTSDPNTKE